MCFYAQAVKSLFLRQPLMPSFGHRWPTSIRGLRDRVRNKAGSFWDNVLCSHKIDLRRFQLPVKEVLFTYVDPVYTWIRQANLVCQKGHKLVWEPQSLYQRDTDEVMYGAGVEFGLLLRAARETIPREGRVALFNISWDGGDTSYATRSASPICVQVMNINGSPWEAVGLVGYMPKLEVSDALRKEPVYQEAQHHILQECAGQVIECVERVARHGVQARIGRRDYLLFPRLAAMTLDTIERVKYFGLRNVRSCSFCRVRNGRSITRRSSRQDPRLLDLLQGWAGKDDANTRVTISQRARARQKLKRHGWNWKRPCRLSQFAKFCLVSVPPQPGVPEPPFGGLAHYERMHTFFIAYCTYLLDMLAELVPKTDYESVQASVKSCYQFRDPVTGRPHPRLRSILKMTHLTAERRVRAIFYWAHALGTKAEVIVRPMRVHVQVAVSTLQLLLIATRGHRAYTKNEMDVVFQEVGSQFFKSLETIAQFLEQKRVRRGQKAHAKNPDNTRPPMPFKRARRYMFHMCFLSHTCVF